MAEDFYDFDIPDDLVEFADFEESTDPECEPFSGLPDETHPTRRHHRGRLFMSLVAAVNREVKRIPQPFQFTLYPGSASWVGSDEKIRNLLDNSDDLTIWKLCYYGQVDGKDKDYAFGVRIRYARHFASLSKLTEWEFVFKVPPNYGDHQWFVGFSVQATKESLARIQKVVDAVITELRGCKV